MSDSSQSTADPGMPFRGPEVMLQHLQGTTETGRSTMPERVETLCQKALAARRQGDIANAEACYRDALEQCASAPINISAHLGFRIYSLLADLLEAEGREDEACVNYLTAIAFSEQCPDLNVLYAPIAAVHNSAGKLMTRQNDPQGAVKHLRLGLDLVEKCDADETQDLSTELYTTLEENLGEALLLLGEHDAARGCFSRALLCHRSQSGDPADEDTASIQRLFGRLQAAFEQLGEHDAAEACAERLES